MSSSHTAEIAHDLALLTGKEEIRRLLSPAQFGHKLATFFEDRTMASGRLTVVAPNRLAASPEYVAAFEVWIAEMYGSD